MSRYLHTMLRVGDLDRSIGFYSKAFGMKELRRRGRAGREIHAGLHRLRRRGQQYGDRADLQLWRREIRNGRRLRPSGDRRAGRRGSVR